MSEPAPLPEVFRAYFVGLEEQRLTALPEGLFHHCFGCGPAHPQGLRVRCFRTETGVVSPIVIARQFAGPPATAHGGIVATYMDEVLAGAAAQASGRVAVTGELTIRYVQPAPLETPLLGRAQAVAEHGRYIDVEGRLEEFGSERLLATARGRFVFVTPKS